MEKYIQPTQFDGKYPDGWPGFTFGDYDANANSYHPGEDYNAGVEGDADLGNRVELFRKGEIVHVSTLSSGYGSMIIAAHQLTDIEKKFVKDNYSIDTNVLFSLYAHLQDYIVAVQNRLDTGSLIGHLGKSGTQYAHLHFEIYAPIGDLAGTAWRFYPVGWSIEKIKKHWLPAYEFIEKWNKFVDSQAPVEDSFLGKPKSYWLQVEKDREDLMGQVGKLNTLYNKTVEELAQVKKDCQKQIDEAIAKYRDKVKGEVLKFTNSI